MKWVEWKRNAVSGNDGEPNMNKEEKYRKQFELYENKIATVIKKKLKDALRFLYLCWKQKR